MTDTTYSHYSKTRHFQSTLQASRIQWPALRNHIPCMAHIIQLALGEFMSSLGVKGHTKSSQAHARNQQFGENKSVDIGNSQRLRKEGNARINKVSAMRPGLAKIIEKVCISRYFESPETFSHIAASACRIDCMDTWSSKWVHWLSNSQSPNSCTTCYGCEDTLECDTGVAWVSLPITRFDLWVSPQSEIQWLLACLPNQGWMDHHSGCHGSFDGGSGTGPSGCRNSIRLLYIMLSMSTLTCSLIWMELRELWVRRWPNVMKTCTLPWSFACQKLSKCYADGTPMMGVLLISAHISDPFHKLRSFRKWDKRMDHNPADETSYTTQYQEAFLKNVGNDYCAKDRHLSVIKPEILLSNYLLSSSMPSRSS